MATRHTNQNGFLFFLQQKGRLWLLLAGALAGLALLLLGNAYTDSESSDSSLPGTETAEALAAYELALEKELKAL